jgi:hypothetical protein
MGKPVVLEGKVVVKPPAPEDVAHLKAEGAGETAGREDLDRSHRRGGADLPFR